MCCAYVHDPEMLVTSVALPEKQTDTKITCNHLATGIHFLSRKLKDKLKSITRLIDTVPKYITEDFFLTVFSR